MKNFFWTLKTIITSIIGFETHRWEYKNPYYYYDPRMRKIKDGKYMKYAITVYRFGRTKKEIDWVIAYTNPKKVMKKVKEHIDYMNQK